MPRQMRKAVHIQQVHRATGIIEDAAAALIARQFHRAAEELEAGGIASAAVIFKPREWDKPLKAAVGPAVARVMLIGAATELRRPKRRKTTASDYLEVLGIDLEDFETEMPPELIEAIEEELAQSFQREFWSLVNNQTRHQIETVLRQGVPEGLSIRDLANQLREVAPSYSRSRAITIARTESTRSLNAGHVLGIEQLEADSGVQVGKSWLSVQGATSRPEHAALDGVTVPTDGTFNLGGFHCHYPGDPNLPPQHSINCLCTITSGIIDADEEEDFEP